jgi:hypothetical protein
MQGPSSLAVVRGSVAALLALGLLLALADGAAAQDRTERRGPWHGEIGFGMQSFDGDWVGVIEVGGLRHEPGNRSLALGGRLLLAPEPGTCVGFGPCPDGPWRVMTVGAQAERRFHVGQADGATPAPAWIGPRAAVSAVWGGGRAPLLEVGGALGTELRVGESGGLSVAGRAGIAGTVRDGDVHTAAGVGFVGGFRWGL